MIIHRIDVREWHDMFDEMGVPIYYTNLETARKNVTEFLRTVVRVQLGEGGDPLYLCDLLTGRKRIDGFPQEPINTYISDQVVDDAIAKMRMVEPNLEPSLATIAECELSTE